MILPESQNLNVPAIVWACVWQCIEYALPSYLKTLLFETATEDSPACHKSKVARCANSFSSEYRERTFRHSLVCDETVRRWNNLKFDGKKGDAVADRSVCIVYKGF